MSKYPPIQVVNEKDEPIGAADMNEIHRQGQLHRIVVVIIKDPEGRMLLQKRSPNVSTDQDLWDASAAGHVDEGEDYLTAAKRELFEELGISDVELNEAAYFFTKSTYEWRKLNRFKRIYQAEIVTDTQLKISEEEITEIKWFTPSELQDLIDNRPDEIVSDFVEVLNKIDNENHQH